MKAQEERAKEAESRGEASRVARQLQEGEHVLLRRPPAKLRKDGQEVKVSAKLRPKARLEAYVVLKRIGETYVLGDVATRREVSTFTQPVHADRLVLLNVQELTTPIAEQTKVILEGISPGAHHCTGSGWPSPDRVERQESRGDVQQDLQEDERHHGRPTRYLDRPRPVRPLLRRLGRSTTSRSTC